MGPLEFTVDERIIKTDFGCVLSGVGEINARKAGPIDCADTHGARFARSVQFAISEFEYAEFRARLTDGEYFRMRCRIIGRRNLIQAFGDDLTISDDHRAERPAASGPNTLYRELNSPCHERVVHFYSPRCLRRWRTGMQASIYLRLSGQATKTPEQVYSQLKATQHGFCAGLAICVS